MDYGDEEEEEEEEEAANDMNVPAGAAAEILKQADVMDASASNPLGEVSRYPAPEDQMVTTGLSQAEANEWRVLVDGPTGESYFWNIRTVSHRCA